MYFEGTLPKLGILTSSADMLLTSQSRYLRAGESILAARQSCIMSECTLVSTPGTWILDNSDSTIDIPGSVYGIGFR